MLSFGFWHFATELSHVRQEYSHHSSAVNVTSTSYINKGYISIPDDCRNKGQADTARHRAQQALAYHELRAVRF